MHNREHLAFLSAGHFFHHYLIAILPVAALSIQSEWSLSESEAVGLGTAMYVMLGIASAPFGWLADRWTRQPLMTLCLLGSAIASILAGFSTGPFTLLCALGLLGIFSAIYHPVGLAMVADNTDRVGLAYATNGVWGNLGSGLAAVVTAILISLANWRIAFVLPSILLLCIGVLYHCRFYTSVRGKPEKHQHNTEDNTIAPLPTGAHGLVQSFAQPVLKVLLVFLIVAAIYHGIVAGALTYTLPRILDDGGSSGMGVMFIGVSTSLILTVGSFAQLVSGLILDRYGAKLLLISLFTGQTVLLSMATMLTGPVLVLALMLFYALLYAWFPITAWLINKHADANVRAQLLSYEYVASLGTTALTIPFVAWMLDLGISQRNSLWLVFCAALVTLAAIAFLPNDRTSAVHA